MAAFEGENGKASVCVLRVSLHPDCC